MQSITSDTPDSFHRPDFAHTSEETATVARLPLFRGGDGVVELFLGPGMLQEVFL